MADIDYFDEQYRYVRTLKLIEHVQTLPQNARALLKRSIINTHSTLPLNLDPLMSESPPTIITHAHTYICSSTELDACSVLIGVFSYFSLI